LCEALLIGQRQANDLGLLNGALRCILDGGCNEISHGAPLKFGGAFEHRVQIGADPSFKTGGGDGYGHGVVLLTNYTASCRTYQLLRATEDGRSYDPAARPL
jgi:hypothetical protein